LKRRRRRQRLLSSAQIASCIDCHSQRSLTENRSARDVVTKEPAKHPHPINLALIANPEFDSVIGISNAHDKSEVSRAALHEPFKKLPGTGSEAKSIPTLVIGSGEIKILTGPDATEKAVKGIISPRILHIATHGFHFGDKNYGLEQVSIESSLVSSGLALAGANHADRQDVSGVDDGLLTALEVTQMDLSGTELVVLSACDTAAGEISRGQGVIGLRRSFLLAGAKALLASLWLVDDQKTATFMELFYRYLQTMTPTQAANLAQRDMIKSLTSNSQIADPGLWAPFILQNSSGVTVPAR
jgi:CHAT domain-containing protein